MQDLENNRKNKYSNAQKEVAAVLTCEDLWGSPLCFLCLLSVLLLVVGGDFDFHQSKLV